MDSSPIIIAIDGFSSCGKSTMAKQLSKILNYVFVDSGAMYRAITLYFMQHQIAINNPKMVVSALEDIQLAFKINPDTFANEIYLNGENVESKIRALSVAERVSDIAAISAVRSFAVKQQQQMGINGGIVMDGRDIGTVVFPQADLKIFMKADPMVRAERRFKELNQRGEHVTMEEVINNIVGRDYEDTHREESPLRKADDAIMLDNTYLTQEEQVDFVMNEVSRLRDSIRSA